MRSFDRILLFVVFCGLNGGLGGQTLTFTTIAGAVGSIGSADGTNSAARFNFPAGLAMDERGNLFVTDLLNHTVRKLTPAGTNWVVTTLAGQALMVGSADGTNSDARFDHPMGITVDGSGNVLVTDKYNDTIRKLSPVGTNWVVTTIAGSPGVQSDEDGTNSQAHFWGPSGVTVDATGRLYVVDSSNFTIRGLIPEGTNWIVSTLAGTPLVYGFEDGINGFAQFDYPYSVTRNTGGALYVTDWGNQAIRQITPSGDNWITETISGFSGTPGTNDGVGLTPKFNSPTGIAVDGQGQVYVSDYGSHTLRRLTFENGEWAVTTVGGAPLISGSADGVGTQARFWRPWGIAVDRGGNVFIADYRNQTIRKGTPNIPPAPLLQIAQFGDVVKLSWPVAASNYWLEISSTLAAGAVWAPVTNAVVVEGTNSVVTNQLISVASFYRLRFNSSSANAAAE